MAQQNDKQKQLLIEVMNTDAKDGLYKQQTAVDFLVEWLANIDWDDRHFRNILQEAKQMEKQHIIKAYEDNHALGNIYGNNGELYYKETYQK